MSCEPLPEDEADFFDLLRMFFPIFIDIKFMVKNCFNKTIKGGLQELADALKVSKLSLYSFLVLISLTRTKIG